MISKTALNLVAALGIAAAGASVIAADATGLRVNGVAVPASRIEASLKAALAGGGRDTPELRAAVRSQLIAQEVLRQAAVKKGYDKHPTTLAARDEAMIRRYLANAIHPDTIAESTVRARYDAIVASLGEREYKASLIAVADAASARQILAALHAGATFADLARSHSLLPSASQGGALDWISFKLPAAGGHTQGLPLPLATALAALSPQGISSQAIELDNRHYLIRLDESRPTRIPVYEAVAPALRQALEEQARERAVGALLAGLIKEARITP